LPFDPSRSLCFPLSNGQAVSGIRLNQVGREPAGTLDPGDADAFCARLTSGLLEIVDEGGTPLVRRVLRTRDLYAGEVTAEFPDLLIEWNEEAATSFPEMPLRVRSSRIGVVRGVNEYTRTGEHRPGGLFIASGTGVRRGRLDRAVSILDFAPTFTSLLGVDFPDADGHPLAELTLPA
jgi:predicted AlkP superfamily phosphohydrolase/phosphomutase